MSDERGTHVNDTSETKLTSTTSWPPIERGRSPLTYSLRSSLNKSTASEPNTSLETDEHRSCANVVNEPETSTDNNDDVVGDAAADDDDDDDDDSEELRALTSAAASHENTDDSSDEKAAETAEDDRDQVAGQSLPPDDCPARHPALSSSSASVLGRIAAGFSTAVSGGLHPLKRSPRVAPELPSPRSPSPKDFFWGPVMPGYPTSLPDSDDVKGGQSTMVIRQTVQLEQTQTSNNSSDADIGLRQAIPIMPMSLAVICCVLNAISPGLGTFVSGVSLTCCSRPQHENIDCSSLLLVNVWVALFQLISSVLFLIGYVWSLVWGFSFITISKEFNSKQVDEESRSESQHDSERAADAGQTSTTTTAMTRTTTTTLSLPDDSTSASPTVNREPPIIILQEAPVAPRQHGLLDAAAAAIWIERQRTLPRTSARERVTTDSRTGSGSTAPMSRRQRLNRRRQQAANTSPAPGRWNDPLTGVLLCPEALEHIVVHSTIVPDPSAAAGPSTGGVHAQTSK